MLRRCIIPLTRNWPNRFTYANALSNYHSASAIVDFEKLRSVVESYRLEKKQLNWAEIARQHFPEASPTDLVIAFEESAEDHREEQSSLIPNSFDYNHVLNATLIPSAAIHKSKSSSSFTPDMDRRLLEWMQKEKEKLKSESDTFESTKERLSALRTFVGGEWPHRKYLERYHQLIYRRPWSQDELDELLKTYESGHSVESFARQHHRPTQVCTERLLDLLHASRSADKRRRMSITLLRWQYNVLGPDWEELSILSGHPPSRCLDLVRRSNHVSTESSLQKQNRRQSTSILSKASAPKRWKSSEDVLLLDAVHHQQGLNKQEVDWFAVSDKVGKQPLTCELRYKRMQENQLRYGFYSRDEDKILLEVFRDHGADFNRLKAVLPNRCPQSSQSRLRRLLKQVWQRQEPGFSTAVSVNAVEAVLDAWNETMERKAAMNLVQK